MNGIIEKSHLQNKNSIKTLYIISSNAPDAFSDHFSDYQVIHTRYEQNESLKRSLNVFVVTSISNTLSTVKFI